MNRKTQLRELTQRLEHELHLGRSLSRTHRGRPAQIGGWHYYFDEACAKCKLETLLAAPAEEGPVREKGLAGIAAGLEEAEHADPDGAPIVSPMIRAARETRLTEVQRSELIRAAHTLSDRMLDTVHREDELVALVESYIAARAGASDALREALTIFDELFGKQLRKYAAELQDAKDREETHAPGELVRRDYDKVQKLLAALTSCTTSQRDAEAGDSQSTPIREDSRSGDKHSVRVSHLSTDAQLTELREVTAGMVLSLEGLSKPWSHLSNPLQIAHAKAKWLNAQLAATAPRLAEGRGEVVK